jgi:hypothetical protein
MRDHSATTRAHRQSSPVGETTAQQLFEQARADSARDAFKGPFRRSLGAVVDALSRQPPRGAAAHAGPGATGAVPRHLRGLERLGCVILHDLRVPMSRRLVDHLVVAESGLYVIEVRSWSGQVSVSDQQLFVDGRLRAGVPEAVRETALSVQAALEDELAAFATPVEPVLCLPAAQAELSILTVGGVTILPGNGMARHLRRAPASMGRDTVVRLALAADRLLERRLGR